MSAYRTPGREEEETMSYTPEESEMRNVHILILMGAIVSTFVVSGITLTMWHADALAVHKEAIQAEHMRAEADKAMFESMKAPKCPPPSPAPPP